METGSRAAIEADQLRKLKATLLGAYSGNSFYKEKYDQAGFNPTAFNSLQDIAKIPFLTKEDLRKNYPLGLLARPLDEIVRFHSSSGTTGKPTLHGLTKEDVSTWSDIVGRALEYAGVTRRDLVLNTFGYGLFTGGLGLHYGAEKIGCAVVPMSSGRTALQVQLLIDLKVTVLTGTPSYLLTIADEIERQKIDIKKDLKLRLCICGAEPWSESLRQDIERRLGVRALDLYGLSEVIGPGVASEQADHQGQLIVWEDHFLPEIIAPDTDLAVKHGDEGELVLTSLSKKGAPVIRYRTGDLASFSETSPLSFRSLRRIKTRIDGMFKVKGVALYSSQIEDILFADPQFSGHFEIELTTENHLDQIQVRIETKSSTTNTTTGATTLSKRLQAMTGVSMDVLVCEPGTLPRSTGKAVRVIDRRTKR